MFSKVCPKIKVYFARILRPHRKNLLQGYTNFTYKTFALRIPWKKPQLFTGRIDAPTTEVLFPTTNIKFLRLVVLAVGNKSSLFTKRSTGLKNSYFIAVCVTLYTRILYKIPHFDDFEHKKKCRKTSAYSAFKTTFFKGKS